jgi:hypothetical protein
MFWKILTCLLFLTVLSCGNCFAQVPGAIPDSVLTPLNQLATDLGQEKVDNATKTNTAAALTAAQTADANAATAVANDVTTVNNDATAVQAAIAAWIAGGGNVQAIKGLKIAPQVCGQPQSTCPTCPNYVVRGTITVPVVAGVVGTPVVRTRVVTTVGRRHILPWRR